MKSSGSRRNKVYCIFYLDKKNFGNIKSQLEEAGINDVKAIVPMVNVLKKTRNGKMVYSEEPVLFNYGFMKMDIKKAHNRMFLNKLKKTIPGIHHWVKDTITVHPRKKKARVDNAEDFDDFSLVAICPRKDVRRFIKIAKEKKQEQENFTADIILEDDANTKHQITRDSIKGVPVISLSSHELKNTWTVTRGDDGVFHVTGEKIEKFARRTDMGNYASVNRLRDIMKKLGIRAELTNQGATQDSIIEISGKTFTLVEQY